MKILITGSAGFIGFHLSMKLLSENHKIIGLDDLNSYYNTNYKKKRLSILKKFKNFSFLKEDLSKEKNLYEKIKNIDVIFHLAAQPGVRYSIINPKVYIKNNINSFINILEFARNQNVKKLFYASSSSVYGNTNKFPTKENNKLNPLSIYASTKVHNEEYAKQYTNHYGLKTIGLRFFTVYGELGRPDMFLYKYLGSLKKKQKFNLNFNGNYKRDITYIKDAVEIMNILLKKKLKSNYNIFNICSSKPVSLNKVISILDNFIKRPKIIYKNKNNLDSLKTYGDNRLVKKITGFKKFTLLKTGLQNTVKNYFELKLK